MPATEELGDTACMFHGGIMFQHVTLFIDLMPVAVDDRRFGPTLQHPEHFFQERGLPEVVLVEKSQELPFGVTCPFISRGSLSAIYRASDIAGLWIALDQLPGFVARCIVDDN